MVFYIHGIASMVATSYVDLNEEAISSFLTDGFEALKKQYQAEAANEAEENPMGHSMCFFIMQYSGVCRIPLYQDRPDDFS